MPGSSLRTYTFRKALALVLGAFAALPILLLAGGFHFYLQSQQEKQITQKNLLLAKSVAGQVRASLHDPLSLLQSINALTTTKEDSRVDLDSLVAGHDGIESILVLDAQGRLVDAGVPPEFAARRADFIGLSMKRRDYFASAVGSEEAYWSDVFSTMLTGRPSLAVSLPIGSGVLVGIFNLDWFDDVIQSIGNTVGVQVVVTDRKGVLILSREREKDRLRINLRSYETVRRGLSGEEGTFLYTEDGQRRLGSVARVPETGWLIIVSQSYRSAFAPLKQLRTFGVAGVVLVLVAALTAAFFLAGHITKPLSSLTRQARHIGGGELGHEALDSPYAEVNTLAAEFGQMAEEVRKRENALRDSEDRLRAVVDGSPAAVALKETDGRYILVNREFARRTGHEVKDLVGLYAEDTNDLEFSERSRWSDREVLRTGHPIEYEYWDNDEKGNIRFYLVNKFPVRNATGKIRAIGIVSADVTDLKRAETELRNLAERVSGVVGVDFFREFVRQILETLEMDIALIGRQVQGKSNVVETVAVCVDGKEAPQITYDLKGTPCEEVIAGQLCVFQSGVRQLFPDDHLLAEMNADGYVGTPLLGANGQVVGHIAVLSRERIRNPNRIVPILKIFAARATAELERLAVEETLRQSESHYRTLFDGLVSGCALHEIICDEQGNPIDYRFLDVNPAFERITGLRKADVLGRCVREVLPNVENYWIETYGKVALHGETVEFEEYNADLDKHFQVSAFSPQLNQFAVSIHDVSERHYAESALRESERDLRGIFDNMVDTFFRIRSDGLILMASPSFTRIFGVEVDHAIGRNLMDFLDPGSGIERLEQAVGPAGRIDGLEISATTESGKTIWLSVTAKRLANEHGKTSGYEGIIRDVTGHKATEDALRRSQRLESIGQLTGGIAHDFNNMLGVIIGNLDFMLEMTDLEGASHKRVSDALHAAWRGADLTKRLLAFSRREAPNPHRNDPNALLDGMTGMLSRVITEEIELSMDLGQGCWNAGFDAGDFEDAILNLVINARDAMTGGGILTIGTENVILDKQTAAELDCEAGQYVKVSVADTGSGMSQAVLDHVFEPFYTTKSEGGGTGLGLSMVYGFLQRSRGGIRIDSETGTGTSVTLFLPRAMLKEEGATAETDAAQHLGGSEAVLVVDDAETMRELAADYLSRQGYQTIQAANGKEALEILGSGAEIDCLFSDIVMPGGVSGEDLAVQALEMVPGVKVLLTTGFTKRMVESGHATEMAFDILPKPYRLEEMARRIRQLLDA